MPAVTELRTPPATQANVLLLRTQGMPKRKIARELGIDKNTVDSIIKAYGHDQPISLSRTKQLIPKAYDALEKGLTSPDALGSGKLGLDFLKVTEYAAHPGDSYHIHGDVSLVNAVGMVPSTAITTSTPMSTGLAVSTGTEAPQKDRLVNLDLSKHENFSQIPDSALLAELERRGYHAVAKPIEATDAEVIESNG